MVPTQPHCVVTHHQSQTETPGWDLGPYPGGTVRVDFGAVFHGALTEGQPGRALGFSSPSAPDMGTTKHTPHRSWGRTATVLGSHPRSTVSSCAAEDAATCICINARQGNLKTAHCKFEWGERRLESDYLQGKWPFDIKFPTSKQQPESLWGSLWHQRAQGASH